MHAARSALSSRALSKLTDMRSELRKLLSLQSVPPSVALSAFTPVTIAPCAEQLKILQSVRFAPDRSALSSADRLIDDVARFISLRSAPDRFAIKNDILCASS